MRGNTENFRRRCTLSQVDLERVFRILKEFTKGGRHPLKIILLGELALQYYGMEKRITVDLDAEVQGDLEDLFRYLKQNHIPADLSEDISGWSVIAMPPGYRNRAETIQRGDFLEVRVLTPVDFIIAKLRQFTEEDIKDAIFVSRKYGIKAVEVEQAADEAIQHSVKDTALFLFRKNVQLFLDALRTA